MPLVRGIPLLAAGLAVAAEPEATPAQVEFFEREVRPVLAEHCHGCHGPEKQKSGLRLDTRAFVLKGGEIGPVVVPGKPEASRLIWAINHTHGDKVEPMPGDDEKIPPAAIAALSALKRPCRVALYTDSEYLKKGITEWMTGWKAKGWKTASRQPVKNGDLWQQLDHLVNSGPHRIEWHWVRGHAGDPGNERADALANRGVPNGR